MYLSVFVTTDRPLAARPLFGPTDPTDRVVSAVRLISVMPWTLTRLGVASPRVRNVMPKLRCVW